MKPEPEEELDLTSTLKIEDSSEFEIDVEKYSDSDVDIKDEIQNLSFFDNNQINESNNEENIESDTSTSPTFTSRKTQHLKQTTARHLRDLTYKCKICNFVFFALKSIKIHEKKNHSVVSNDHKLQHNKITCKYCNLEFIQNCNLKNHVMKVHLNMTPYTCKICNENFKYKPTMENHIKFMHTEAVELPCYTKKTHSKGAYECDYCHRDFSEKNDLKYHILSEHGKFKCKDYSQFYYTNKSVYQHENSHPGNYKCDRCPKTNMNFIEFKRHNRIFHKKKTHNNCRICNMKFPGRFHLLEHMVIHSNNVSYVCDYCYKGFIVRENLNKHLKTHFQKIYYSCMYCYDSFNTSEMRRLHEKIHTTPFDTSKLKKSYQQWAACFVKLKSIRLFKNLTLGV